MKDRILNDITVECKDCGKKFTLTADEQEWFRKKGFELPKRCIDCRKLRKTERDNNGSTKV